jgi:hypothetical protein
MFLLPQLAYANFYAGARLWSALFVMPLMPAFSSAIEVSTEAARFTARLTLGVPSAKPTLNLVHSRPWTPRTAARGELTVVK